jgi:hypothetical protein
MKKITSLLLAVIAFVSSSCNFSAGTKTDLGTGLSISYNGFGVDEVLLVGPDNTAMINNDVQLNTQIAIVAQGLVNYVLKDDKAFPGLMLSVTDKQGKAIIDEADLFAGTEGYSATDAGVLRGTSKLIPSLKVKGIPLSSTSRSYQMPALRYPDL